MIPYLVELKRHHLCFSSFAALGLNLIAPHFFVVKLRTCTGWALSTYCSHTKSINLSNINKNLENAENQTCGSWVRRVNSATLVVKTLPLQKITQV